MSTCAPLATFSSNDLINGQSEILISEINPAAPARPPFGLRRAEKPRSIFSGEPQEIASSYVARRQLTLLPAQECNRHCRAATIGTFTSTANGFTGQIRTLALNVKARIARVENPSEKGPQFRVYAGTAELGAAWQKTSEQGRDYLSVKLDDPSFPAPIYATLAEVEGEDGLQLIWSRSNRD
jgi:uncharacterized protein (DUF736 family)